MMLADSNIIIYAGSENYNNVLTWLLNELPAVSAITFNLTSATHNTEDFMRIKEINLFDPLQ